LKLPAVFAGRADAPVGVHGAVVIGEVAQAGAMPIGDGAQDGIGAIGGRAGVLVVAGGAAVFVFAVGSYLSTASAWAGTLHP